MIQRFLYTAIKNGLAAIAADPTILDDLFEETFELSATEVAAIKTMMVSNPPEVHHGYARQDYDFPLYSIIMASEGEDTHFIGDEGGMITEPGHPDFGADIQTSIWQHSYQILAYAEHPDVTTYIYEILKNIIIGAASYFNDNGLFQTHVSGMDMAPDPRYIPEHLFVRQLLFKCNREFCRVDKDSKLGKAFQVGGIHVDKSGSPSDVGGVKTLVTTYLDGEEDEG